METTPTLAMCYTASKHSLGILFRPCAEPLNLFAQSPVFPCRMSHYHSIVEVLVNSAAKLYVGNFSYEMSEAGIRTLFEPHGEVASVALITDRDTGRSKGFGFVEMGSADEAQKAKSALDGTQVDGRALKVDVAKEKEARAPRSGGGYGGGSARRLRWRRRQPLVTVAPETV